MKKGLLNLMLIAWIMGPNALADLTWQTLKQDLYPETDDTCISTNFRFTNKSDHIVTIKSIVASCGCTTAEASKLKYAPDEHGEVKVTYNFGNQMGLQIKNVVVSTDEPSIPPYVLSICVHIPEVLKISTRYVFWSVGDKPLSQVIQLAASPTKPVKILSVFSDSLDINASLHVKKEGTDYESLVTPVTTQVESRGTLIIETNLQQEGHNRKFYAYANVIAKKAKS